MLTSKFNTAIRFTAVLGLVFIFAVTIVSAGKKSKSSRTQSSSTSEATTSSTSTAEPANMNYYSVSMIVKRYNGNGTYIAKAGKDWVWMHTTLGAVDAYMDEQGVDQVEITADMLEEWVQRDDGSGFWRLSFVFGPSGCFFEPPLRLEFSGKYVSDITEVWLYDEIGEALESFNYASGKKIIFEIPHFSRYSYDMYNY